MRPSRLLGALLVMGLLAAGAVAPRTAAARSDTVPSFSESPGCGGPNGIRGPQMGPGPIQSGWPYDALPGSTELHGPWADFFGRTISEVHSDLVVVHLPGLAKDLYIHERVVPAFNAVLANLAEEASNGNVYTIRSDTWSYNPATIAPGRHLSFHGIGASIDVNSTTNPYRGDNVLVTDMPGWFVDAWRDAGWCWGGDWISIKDPMHFAWMGPINTPGYGADPAPYPADSSASTFSDSRAVSTAFAVTTPVTSHFGIDVDRDGAPDVVRLQQSYKSGAFRLEATEGWRRFETCTATQWAAAPPVTTTSAAMGDFTADGRPELWMIDDSGATVTTAVYRIVSTVGGGTAITGTPQLLQTVISAAAPGSAYAIADHNRDGQADLYVITSGTTTRIQVMQGPALTTPLIDTSVAIASDASYRFSVGDHDLDGVPDLYAVSGSSPATVQVAHGGSGFTSGPTSIATGVTLAADETLTVEDYDGDGRDDLYLVGADGALRVILGGVRAGGADLDGWFVKVDLSWGWGTGCVQPAYLRIVTDPPVASQILIDGQPADTWGLTWLKLPPGTYEVSFRDLEGFTTPGAATVTVSEGATTAHTGTFAQRGFLRVLTDPPVPATISVDGTPRNDWGMWTDLVPGTYQVCFGGVEDFTPPACEEAIVSAGDTTTITGTYTAAPGTAGPTDYGWLRVVTNPPVPSQIIVDGIARDTWGLNWLKVPPGTYDVSFSDLEGFTTPTPQTVDVVSGTTTAVQGDFIQRGWLRVLTSPPVVGTVLVDGVPRNDWGLWTDFEPGTYEVCFGAVSGLTAPSCQSAVVAAGDTVTITGVYE